MKKDNLRSLGVGFLIASMITAAYATFVQGHLPIEGVTLPSLLNGQTTSQLQKQLKNSDITIESLKSESEQMDKTIQKLSSEKEKLKEKVDQQSESIAYLESLREKAGEDEQNSTDNANQTADETSQSLGDSGQSFTISPGENSSQIAKRLEEEGLVGSATEFQALIDQWQLSSLIQAGDYQLDASMTIHEIASQLTNGAYYYQ